MLNELKNIGVKDVLIICADGLTGIKDAINAAVEEMDPHDVFGKALIFEVRQNPYYPEETESMLIGAVNYLGEMTYI